MRILLYYVESETEGRAFQLGRRKHDKQGWGIVNIPTGLSKGFCGKAEKKKENFQMIS